ncbi:MAG: hypothetical protein KJS87_05285 [Alphaproteobacteria bacterium]|nr:hypothetical protein [Alphaproteobacteria bacterium]
MTRPIWLRKFAARRTSFIAAGLAAALLVAAAATVTRVPSAGQGEASPGIAAQGAMREQVFLVFDDAEGRVVRRAYSVWQPADNPADAFEWTPHTGQAAPAGPLDGSGRLVWRRAGVSLHDPSSIVGIFEGTLREGRYEGEGELHMRDGAFYRGAWKRGLKEGEGELTLPDGTFYVGAFKAGVYHGRGTLTGPDGAGITGTFVDGRAQGRMLTRSASGDLWESVWNAGTEDTSTRSLQLADLAPTGVPATAPLRIGLQVDRQELPQEDFFGRVVGYRLERTTAGLRILPDDRRLMRVWKQGGPVSEDTFDYRTNGALQYNEVALNVRLQNTTAQPVRIDAGRLVVSSSRRDAQPVMAMLYDFKDEKACASARSAIFLVNHGWGEMRAPRATFTLGGRTDRSFGPVALPPVPGVTVSGIYRFAPDLRQAGFAGQDRRRSEEDVAGGRAARCSRVDTDAACQAKYADVIRTLGPRTGVRNGLLSTPVAGRITYEWRPPGGTWRQGTAPFDFRLLLSGETPCAEGGGLERPETGEAGLTRLDLSLDRSAYNLAIPISRTLEPGGVAAVRLLLTAREASSHSFRIVFDVAGTGTASPQVDLVYFRPRIDPGDLFKSPPDGVFPDGRP